MVRLGLFAWIGLAASAGWAQTSFSDAQLISGQWGNVTNDNTGVVPDVGGPSHAGFLPQHTLWYKWVAPESGEVTFDTLGSVDAGGTNLDTVLAVYIGSSISQLIQVAANDDYYPFTHLVQTSQTYGQKIDNPDQNYYPLPLSGPSILRFNATAGTTYYIAVDSIVGKGYSEFGSSLNWLSQAGQGLMALNWALRPSGVLRFATEEYDIDGWRYNPFLNPGTLQPMPMPLYQCTETESFPGGGGYPGNEPVHDTYYTYDPGGVLVTVTRVAGSCGRLFVDYTTADITNTSAFSFGPMPAAAGVDYTPVSGTLVFDDFEMSKTIVIPIIPTRGYYNSTNNPNDPDTKWPTNLVDKDFNIVLSNPRLDAFETTNVSPPRLDTPFSTARVRIMSGAGLGTDPDENWTGDTGTTPPSDDVYNFGKRNYRVPRDVDDYWGTTTINIGVFRTHQRVPGTRSETIHYRVNGTIGGDAAARQYNNFFALNPGSEYAIPDTNNYCPDIFPWGTNLTAFPNYDFTMADGDVTIGNTGYGVISFSVNNDLLTKFNKDFNIVIYRIVNSVPVSVGENNECHVTILFDDTRPAAGSVDEFYNTDFGTQMKPAVLTVPSNQAHPGTDGTVWALAVQPDDKAIVAGEFTSYNGTIRNCIARATPGGPIDTGFDPGTGANDGMISSLALLPDGSGKMMIGGTFNHYNGAYRPYIARLNSNGLLDGTFAPTNYPDGPVWALAIQTNNQVVVVGDFMSIGSVSRAHIARYNADGSLDLSFDPSTNAPDDTVWCLALQPDGKVVIGGQFANLGGYPLSSLARLNADGSADGAFNANLGFGVDGVVQAVAIQGGTSIVIGGEFKNVGVFQRTRIARLNSDGTVDNTFNAGTGADDTVYNINAQSDGSMYVGGLFTSFNGTHRLGFTRLYADGSVDTTFLDTAYNQFAGLHRKYYDRQWGDPDNADPNPDPRPFVYASQVLPDGNIAIGGGFKQVGGGQANAAIRFDSDYPTSTIDTNVWTEPKARDGVRNRSNFARLIGGATPGPGNIGLLYTNYSVNKSQLSLNVDIIRTNGGLGYSSANFAVQPGLAQSGIDYVYNSTPPLYLGSWWPDGEIQPYYSSYPRALTRAHSDGFLGINAIPTDIYGHDWFPYPPGTLMLTIKNSGVPGDVDTQVQLANPSGADQFFLGGQNIPLGNALGASVAPFTIVDDNRSSGMIGFAVVNFYVNENGTNAVVVITRTNGTAGFPSVVLSTVDGTGHAGSNYMTYSKRLSFSPGVSAITNREIKIIDDHISEPSGLTVGLRLSGVQSATLGLSAATLNIVDNDYDPGYVTLSSATYTNNESSGAAVLVVNRIGANKGTVSVQCITTNGTALSGVNYIGVTNTLVWNDGDASPRYVTVPLIRDGLVGPNTTFGVYLTNSIVNTTNAPLVLAGSPTSATVTIIDDDYYGGLQFSAPSYQVNENGGYITIPVIRTGGSAQTLTVNYYTANGPLATSSGPLPNFVGVTNTLIFNPGEVSKSFNVAVLDDGMTNGPPSQFYFTVNLSLPTPPGVLGYQTSARVYIVDAEKFNVPAGSYDTSFAPEPGFNGDVYGVALQTNGQIIAVGNFSVVNNYPRNNLARLNSDSSLDTTFLNGLSGANGPIQTIMLQTDGRFLVGGPFSMINGLNRNGLARLMSDGTLDSSFNPSAGGDGTVYALAETFLPDRRILIGGNFLNMNGLPHQGLARLNTAGALDPTFNPDLSVNGTVYAIAAYPTNTIQGGKILIGGNFTLVNGVVRNGVARLNSDGTLDLGFDPGSGATNAVRALAIQLDGRVLLGGSFTSFNGYALNHVARLNVNGQVDTSFNIGGGADDTVDAIVVQPDTRILLVGLFSHANGVSRNRITRLLPDGTVDPAINFGMGADSYIDTIVLQPDGMMIIGGGFTSYDGASRPHLARIYGGSITGSGVFQFTSGNFQADENSTNAVLTVRRRGGTAGNMTVDFSSVGLTAVPGVNFSNVQTSLHFAVGETLQSVIVPVMDDFKITPDLIVSNYLSNPSPPAGIGAQFYALLTILNDDSTVSFKSASYVAHQDDSGIYVDLIRQGSSRNSASVDFFTTTNGTAVAGVDFTTVSNRITFQPGDTDLQVRISILNNPLAANDTTVIMQLSNTVNTLLTIPTQATLTILTTNRSPGQLMFSQTNYVVGEGDGFLMATIVRTNGHNGVVSVNFSTLAGSALPGLNYVTTNGSLTFDENDISKSFPVQILQGSQFEGNQTFSLLLSSVTGGATLAGPTNVPVTIIEDHVGVSFVSPFYVVSELSGNVSLTVYRQNGTNGVTTVNYSTTNLTAQAGSNYVGVTNGTLTFNPGEVYKSITIGVLHDPRVTGDVSFGVNLFNPSAPAQLGAPSFATVLLQDAETGFSIASTNLVFITNADLSISTNASFGVLKSSGSNVVITVARFNPNTGTVGVNYATADGTALAGVNYIANNGALIFSNGIAFQTVEVQIISNQVVEGDRTFTFYLTNATPTNVASLMTPYVATVTITDDVAGLSFSSPTYSANENGQQAVITVVRSNYTNSAVSVDFSTADGSGQAGVNYYPTNGTLVFTNGDTAKTFSVALKDDHVVDGNHTVLLNLSNAVGNAAIVNPTSATLLIKETDGSLVIPAGVALISESGPVNGVIDPGETVTLLFGLRNANGTNTANLVATLLATNGIASPSGSQTYGVLTAQGPSASRPFTFTANGTNGQTITAILQLRDGNSVLSSAVFPSFTLGKTPVTFSNNTAIVINDMSSATPYPSVINVSNMNGLVTQATVTLSNLSHSYPKDIDALLVSPTGQKTYLMAHCGSSYAINNVTLTFDDATNSVLPYSAQINSGTYHPTSYAVYSPTFPAPPAPFATNATAPPYATNLSVFNGTSPNGAWALYLYDDTSYNSGSIANGWILNLNLTGPVPGAADVALAMTASAPSMVATSNLTYTLIVTNFGPSSASNVVVMDTLPSGAVLTVSNATQGSVTNAAGLVVWTVGSLAKDATAQLTLAVQPAATGTITNSATVTTASADPNPDDDSASVVTTVIAPTADLVLGLADAPDPVPTGYNLIYNLTVTNLGPGTASGVMVVDTLPPGVSFVAAWPSNNYTVVGRVVTFLNLGNVGSNQQVTATIVVKPTVAGTLTDSATCSSSVTDPHKANNNASVKTIVEAFQLSLSHGGGSLILSWPSDAANAYLEAATNLSPPTVWTPVTNLSPSEVGGQKTITLPIGSGARFFRLHGTTP
jgi:uncharacterized delta-60 repeat protein/uncharacterized repeat protein (TIGR01451 family)